MYRYHLISIVSVFQTCSACRSLVPHIVKAYDRSNGSTPIFCLRCYSNVSGSIMFCQSCE